MKINKCNHILKFNFEVDGDFIVTLKAECKIKNCNYKFELDADYLLENKKIKNETIKIIKECEIKYKKAINNE